MRVSCICRPAAQTVAVAGDFDVMQVYVQVCGGFAVYLFVDISRSVFNYRISRGLWRPQCDTRLVVLIALCVIFGFKHIIACCRLPPSDGGDHAIRVRGLHQFPDAKRFT